MNDRGLSWLRWFAYLLWVAMLGLFFAMVEIQIEGAHGWAASLPTWRIEKHWLLDLFWGGRPLTGYHIWVFSFMALIFHLPVFFAPRWTWYDELQIIGGVSLFWIVEDSLWFILNPAFGLERLSPQYIPWHKHWLLGLPSDYVVYGGAALLLLLIAKIRPRLSREIS